MSRSLSHYYLTKIIIRLLESLMAQLNAKDGWGDAILTGRYSSPANVIDSQFTSTAVILSALLPHHTLRPIAAPAWQPSSARRRSTMVDAIRIAYPTGQVVRFTQ